MEHNRKIGKKNFSKLFVYFCYRIFLRFFFKKFLHFFFALFWVSQNVRTNQRKGRGRQCEISFEHCKGTYAFAIPKYFRIV